MEIKNIEDISTLNVKDGDVILVKCKDPLESSSYIGIQRGVQKVFGGGRKIIILGNGMELESISKEVAKRILEKILEKK